MGPLGLPELVALILGGEVPEDTLIWRVGLGEWVKANSVEEIQRELPPPIPGRDGDGGPPGKVGELAARRHWRRSWTRRNRTRQDPSGPTRPPARPDPAATAGGAIALMIGSPSAAGAGSCRSSSC